MIAQNTNRMSRGNTTATKEVFGIVGPQYRQRYEEAFFRNEVTTIREQLVSVLHDTLAAFMRRTESALNAQEQRQNTLEAILKKVLGHLGLEVQEVPPSPIKQSTPQAGGSRTATAVDEAPSEGIAVQLVDEEGNPTNLIATISTPSTSFTEITTHTEQEVEGFDRFHEGEDMETNADETDEDSTVGREEHIVLRGPYKVQVLSNFRGESEDGNIPDGPIDWDMLEAESKTMITLPERKGKGGKVSGRLGPGSPAWTHFLRNAIRRTIGDDAMLRYAKGGSLLFRAEQSDNFNDIKGRVLTFCKKYGILAPDDRLMDEIAWAFLRNKKRYKAK